MKVTIDDLTVFLSFKGVLNEVEKKVRVAYAEAQEAYPDEDVNLARVVEALEAHEIEPIRWFAGLFPWGNEKSKWEPIDQDWKEFVENKEKEVDEI